MYPLDTQIEIKFLLLALFVECCHFDIPGFVSDPVWQPGQRVQGARGTGSAGSAG